MSSKKECAENSQFVNYWKKPDVFTLVFINGYPGL
jgi:hypothetical protein